MKVITVITLNYALNELCNKEKLLKITNKVHVKISTTETPILN
jgi:hypothetical protein